MCLGHDSLTEAADAECRRLQTHILDGRADRLRRTDFRDPLVKRHGCG